MCNIRHTSEIVNNNIKNMKGFNTEQCRKKTFTREKQPINIIQPKKCKTNAKNSNKHDPVSEYKQIIRII